MPFGLRFDLRLQARQPDHVVVSVLLEPHEGGATLEGVSLQILGPRGGTVSARMVLPISGALTHRMVSTLELRALHEEIPPRSRVVGMAWGAEGQLETSVPTDPYTQLQAHVQAIRIVALDLDDVVLERIDPESRARIAAVYPWIELPRLPSNAAQLTVVDHEPSDEEALDGLLDELEIDAESAEWLKSLMDEPEEDAEGPPE